MSDHLFRRRRKDGSLDLVWKCWFTDAGGKPKYRSTGRGEWAKPPAPAVLYQRGRRGEVRTPADEGRHVSDQTIKKELLVLRMALERAQRARHWARDPDQNRPPVAATNTEPWSGVGS